MPSRLSSLLVRDGLVGVKRMEKAFQRQVIYGGTLDTILLEMNFVPEDRLTQYLALASGLPPAARDEGDSIEVEALALLGKDLAEQFHAVPLTVDGEALRVLVCAPLEMSELEDLADLLDRPLQPLITTEYRWHLAFATAYEQDPPARFTTLARQVAADEGPSPVGRARSVIVDDPAAAKTASELHADALTPRTGSAVPADPIAPEAADTLPLVPAIPRKPALPAPPAPVIDRPTEPMAVPSLPPVRSGRAHPNTIVGHEPNRANVPTPPMGSGQVQATPPAGTPVSVRRAVTPSTGIPSHIPESDRLKLPPVAIRGRDRSAPIATAGRDSPLAIGPARELLATAEDRDSVFLTLLRAARTRARYAALLTVQGGAAIGRVALAEPGIDVSGVSKVLVPLDAMSPFRTVVNTQQPHIGALISNDPSVDAMTLRLGGTLPPSALIMPIVLRDRVVALVVAHRVHSDLKLIDITELLPLAAAAADALGRLIVKHKSAGYRTADSTPRIEIDTEQVDTKKIKRVDAEWRAPAPAERPSVPALDGPTELTITAEPPRPIAEVLTEIELSREGGADDAISDAIERAPDVLPELVQKFPGKLRVDRFAVSGRPLRASQYGGLLELVVRLGSAASELLIDKMSSTDRDTRFYATICAGELRPRNAVYALVERLFDQDFGVRAAAIEALSGYPMQDLTHALARARRAVHSNDPETVAAATAAIVQLGDTEAVGDLIGVIERGDRGSEHVRKALIALTGQDFGASERKWRKWWEASRKRHRIEWLIDSLGHKDETIREAAIADLRRLTGEYFGYHHDLPKRERELAAHKWVEWWKETGQRRFVHKEDERNRPTAQLPVRRD